ncbi:uncharacterized protein LOC135357202 [Latimeria chalumnae]|uniref:uncharacterized protein LOC135357202 n=1 Tax=Latimeria chalumnae TaxID=7897 RepID=UPI00313AD1AD
MGGGGSKTLPCPPKGTPGGYMYAHYGSKSCRYLKKWNWYTRDDPGKQFPLVGSFDLDKIIHLRGALESLGAKISQDQWDVFFDWYDETSKRRYESTVRGLKDSQQKLKAQLLELKEQKARKIGNPHSVPLTPTAPLFPQLTKKEEAEEETEDILDLCPPNAGPPPYIGESEAVAGPSVPIINPNQTQQQAKPQTRSMKREVQQSGHSGLVTLSTSYAHQFPLWEFPGRDAEGPSIVYVPWSPDAEGPSIVHVPWSPTDLRNLIKDFPSIRDDPLKFQEELKTVISCYNPNWADMNQLLRAILPSEVRQRLFQVGKWPSSPPGRDDLSTARQKLVDSIPQVCPRKTDWAKINNCRQAKGETPADYLDRLKEVFDRHSGISNAADRAPEAVAAAFVQGLSQKLQQQLRSIAVGWEAKPLNELVTIANHCAACQEQRKDTAETRLMALQLQYHYSRGRGRFAGRGRGGEFSGGGRGFGFQNNCYYCGQPGHWKLQCPYRPALRTEAVPFYPKPLDLPPPQSVTG